MLRIGLLLAGVVAFVQAIREAPRRPRDEVSPVAAPPRGGGGPHTPGAAGFFKDFRQEVKEDRLPTVAASLAYYAMMALVPALIALVSIYGLIFDPADVERQIADLADILPDEAEDLVTTQLGNVVNAPAAGLGIGLVVSILAALWSASSGVKALISATNIVHGIEETRGFVKLRGLALGFTLAIVIFAAAAFAGVVLLPRLLRGAGPLDELLSLAVWPGVVIAMTAGLAVLYRVGPNHQRPGWEWAGWGALAASVLWLLATLGFSVYVGRFGSFDATYGTLAGAIVLLLWFYLSGLVVLLGAEFNAVLEQRRAAGLQW